jgi:hypothetical protein
VERLSSQEARLGWSILIRLDPYMVVTALATLNASAVSASVVLPITGWHDSRYQVSINAAGEPSPECAPRNWRRMNPEIGSQILLAVTIIGAGLIVYSLLNRHTLSGTMEGSRNFHIQNGVLPYFISPPKRAFLADRSRPALKKLDLPSGFKLLKSMPAPTRTGDNLGRVRRPRMF